MSISNGKLQKDKKWFQSSFNFGSEPVNKKPRNEKSNLEKSQSKKGQDNIVFPNVPNNNWLEKYKPSDVDELAVNNKKIQEVEEWITKAIRCFGYNGILLLSGPSGSGKTTTVELIAKKYNISVSEWITPLDIDLVKDLGANSYTYQEKQSDKFLDFLLKASRFRSLLSNNQSNRIVVVEDFPNIFTREPSEFHKILEKYQDRGKSPLIFICTDSNDRGQSMLWNLFPPNILEKYHTHQISFNPIATTGMKSALKRIVNLISKSDSSIKQVDQENIDVIINSSMGDIRSAVNNLCFALLKGATPLKIETKPAKRSKVKEKKTKSKNESKLSSMGRSESLTVMHGVGRVLNPKFEERSNPNEVQKFVHSPESIVEHFIMQPESFVGYIHENYLPHFATIGDVEIATNFLSDADCFMNEWREKFGKNYGLTVAVSGVMLANKTPVSSWHPIRAAKKNIVNYPRTGDVPLIDRNEMISGRVLAMDYKGFCDIIAAGIGTTTCDEDSSLIEEYTITEY